MHFYWFGPIFKKYGIKVNTHTYTHTHKIHLVWDLNYTQEYLATLIKGNTQFCTS